MTTQQTTDLATYILAQIAADEADALAILARVAADPGSFVVLGLADLGLAAGDCPSDLGEYDPAHVLATCAAHRAIVEEHPRCDVHDRPGDECDACLTCGDGSIWPCPTLRALATIYAARPGFDPAWVAS